MINSGALKTLAYPMSVGNAQLSRRALQNAADPVGSHIKSIWFEGVCLGSKLLPARAYPGGRLETPLEWSAWLLPRAGSLLGMLNLNLNCEGI